MSQDDKEIKITVRDPERDYLPSLGALHIHRAAKPEPDPQQQYDESIQPKWYERIIGAIVAFLMGGW